MTSPSASAGRSTLDPSEDGGPPPALLAGAGAGADDSPGASPARPDSDSDSNSDSGQSGVSNISGLNWKPNAGPICWVQEQIGAGVDPREVLHALRPGLGSIPGHIDDITLWKLVIEMLSEPPRREKLRHVNTLSDVVRLIRGASNVIVLTGAGVSVSCGIPDFRSRDGIYARLAVDFPDLPDPQAMFDIHYFRRDPRPFFKFAREIYPGQFKPSPCHRFIRMLERQGKLLRNYTQNIDTLEQQAGIENVIQCHGSFATASCQRCRHRVPADQIREAIFRQTIPGCPRCADGAAPAGAEGGVGRVGSAGPADIAAAGTVTAAGSGADTTGGAGGALATSAATDATGEVTGGTATASPSGSPTDRASDAPSTAPAACSSATSPSAPAPSAASTAGSTTGAPSAAAVAHDVFVAAAVDSTEGVTMAEAAAAADVSDTAALDAALTHGAEGGAGHHGALRHGHGASPRGGLAHRHGSGGHRGQGRHHGGRRHGEAAPGVDSGGGEKHDAGNVHREEKFVEGDGGRESGVQQADGDATAVISVRTGGVSPLSSDDRVSSSEDARSGPVDEDTGDSGFVAARENEDEAARAAHRGDDLPPAIMKPDIVFFGEGLSDEFHQSMELDRDRCDLLIVIGSSLKVRPVALIPSSVNPEVAQILINREPLPHLNCDVQLLGDCDVIVDHLCRLLGGPFSELLRREPPPAPLRELTELPPRAVSSPAPPPPADPAHEHDTDALRHCWQRKVKESVAARLPEGAYLYQAPSRYIFPGAEVLVDPDDSESDRDSPESDSDDQTLAAGPEHSDSAANLSGSAATPPLLETCPATPPGHTAPPSAPSAARTATGEMVSSAEVWADAGSSAEDAVAEVVGAPGGLKRPLDDGFAGPERPCQKRAALSSSGEPAAAGGQAEAVGNGAEAVS